MGKLLASAAAGAVVSALILSLLRAEPAPAPPAFVAAPAPDPELSEALRELRAELARLRARLDAPPARVAALPAASAPVPVPSPATASASSTRPPAARPDEAPRERRSAPARVVRPEVVGASIPRLTHESGDLDRFTRAHHFWSYQRVLDRYGAPLRIDTGNGLICFLYQHGRQWTQFQFCDRMLVRVDQWEG